MNEIDLSIIIPAFNTADYIKDCLNSFLPLDSEKVEIIAVDDGSTDNTFEIIQSYSAKFQNFVAVKQENQKQSVTRNNGLKLARGKYIFFCDSDDYVNLEIFKNFVDETLRLNVDIAIGGGKDLFGNEIKTSPRTYEHVIKLGVTTGAEYYLYAIKHNELSIVTSHRLYRRDFLITNNLSFMPGVLHEDEEFTPKVFALANSCIHLPFLHYVRRHRLNSLTKNTKHKYYNPVSSPSFVKVIESLSRFEEVRMLSDLQKKVITHGMYKCYLEIIRRELYYKKEKIGEMRLTEDILSRINKLLSSQRLNLFWRFKIFRFKLKTRF